MFVPLSKGQKPIAGNLGKPSFVCEIKYAEWTSEGILRIPIFLGLREDKIADDEKNEKSFLPRTKQHQGNTP